MKHEIRMKSHRSNSSFSLALITGASSGIGEALAHLLASKGIPLIITGRNREHLDEVAATLRRQVEVSVIAADLALPEGRQKIVEAIRLEAPDLIINNAGFGHYGDALDYSTEEELQILTVNAHAVLEFTLEGARTLRQYRKPGVILNVSSAASYFVFPGSGVYAASKAFVTQVSQSLDFELEEHRIRVLVTCPGMVRTNFAQRAGSKLREPPSYSMQPDYVAECIWQQIVKRKRCVILDGRYRFFVMLSRWVPTRWLARYLRKNIASRLKNT